jgi:heptosyltransferase II
VTSIPKAVLVLRFSAVGDVILTGSALRALKTAWPETRIIFGTKEKLAPLIEHHPCVDAVLALRENESVLQFSKRAKELGVEQVLNLHGTLRSRLIVAALGLPSVTWEKRGLMETIGVKWFGAKALATEPLAAKSHRAVELLTGQQLQRHVFDFFPSDTAVASARTKMHAAGIDFARPILGMSLGAGWATKRWPAEKFGQLAKLVPNEWQVVVGGSESEKQFSREAKIYCDSIFDLSGLFDLGELGGFVSQCEAFVSNDSGPMHMARGLGVPTLALFGSTDPNLFSFEGHAVLFKSELPCAPCSFYGRKTCPKAHFKCLNELSVESARSALTPLLDGKTRRLVLS